MSAQPETAPIPWLHDLIPFPERGDGRDHKRIALAAENVAYPILPGIEAIGQLLYHIGEHGKLREVDPETMRGIGDLIANLARVASQLGDIKEEAEHLHAHPGAPRYGQAANVRG